MDSEEAGMLRHKALEELSKSLDMVGKLDGLANRIAVVAGQLAASLIRGNKIMFCGNGGSAADSQHLAAELVGRMREERGALAGLALTTDTSVLTAVANDYGYEQVFARQIAALGAPGDVLVALSTSGESPNIVAAVAQARKMGMVTVGLTGRQGRLRELVDYTISIPADETPNIQEGHIIVGHIVLALAERIVTDHGT